MSLESKIAYNREQSVRYGWEPSWFGATDFNEELIDNITSFQSENGLAVDGMCGPSTYRRIWTQRESEKAQYILYNERCVEIHWPKVVLWDEEGGLGSRSGAYKNLMGKTDRDPQIFITHWDVCLSSKSCASVLSSRGLSVHFCVDNDGTIYQLLDLQNIGYHAGNANTCSIGVEVSDAYSLKYQSWYEQNGFGSRPIWKDVEVHGKTLDPFLGFYDVQIEAIAALWEATSRACNIPLQLPDTKSGVDDGVKNNRFHGYACHFHQTSGKIDTAGLNLEYVLQRAKTIREINHG